jgi:hypothetical protein
VRPVCREHMEHRRKMEEEAAAKAAAAKGALNKKNNELRKKLQNVKSRLFATIAIKNVANAPAKK